jgi:hypothetical protein
MLRFVKGIAPLAALLFMVACGSSASTKAVSAALDETPPNYGDFKTYEPPDVTPERVAGNPGCTDLGYLYGLKWDYPEESQGGTYNIGTGTVTWATDGTYVGWKSTFGIDAVIIKGGPAANVYRYQTATAPESFGPDAGLVSPDNDSGGPAGLSHVEFCFDYEVVVTKTATPTFTRTYVWQIGKVGDQAALTLSPNQQFLVNYTVTVDVRSSADSDFAVAGTIKILNPDPKNKAIITEVADVISPGQGIEMTVDCGEAAFPLDLYPGNTLECTYSAALPDGTKRTNTATVTTDPSSLVGGASVTVDVTFGDPTNLVDECVDASDTYAGPLGTVCVKDSLPKTFTYSRWIGPYSTCGDYTVDNTASFLTNDTGATGFASWTVTVTVPCAGCTLTPGYWKTHSREGPAPYDDAWLNLGPMEEDTPFFLSGKTYNEVLWTAPQGNAYYILAHAYIAAVLNILNGADPAPASTAIWWAQNSFFNTYGPTSTLSRTLRNQAIANATILDNYNNGYIGPGHCSE